jgi:hypothetical protein
MSLTSKLSLRVLAVAFAATAAITAATAAPAMANGTNHEAQPAQAAGTKILKGGSNQYGSYEFVEQPAAAPSSPDVIRPANGGGCNSYIDGSGTVYLKVCAAVTGSGSYVDEMTNKSYFDTSYGPAEVQILSPSKVELASWYGTVKAGNEVTAYWTPNQFEATGYYCAKTTYGQGVWYSPVTESDCVYVS